MTVLNRRGAIAHIDALLKESRRYQLPVAHPAAENPVEWIRSRIGIDLDPWQAGLVRDLPIRILLNCPRQSGKSTGVACMAAVRMVLKPTFVLAIAPSYRQSKLLLEKIQTIFHPGEISRVTADTVELHNGSKFIAAPGDKPSTIRGMSPQLLIMDEFSRVKVETTTAVLPSIAAQGDEATIVCLSTPAGTGNPFHQYWTSTDSEWVRVFVRPEDCFRYTPEVLQTMKSKLSPRQYQQEFEGRFLEGAGALFSQDAIDALFERSEGMEWTGRIPETETFTKLF